MFLLYCIRIMNTSDNNTAHPFIRLLLIIVILFIGSPESKAQLQSDFSADHQNGCSPVNINFTDLSTGNPVSWNWDFGDGTSLSNQQNPSHIYSTSGNFTVKLVISDLSSSDSIVKTNFISVSNPGVQIYSLDSVGCRNEPQVIYSQVSSAAPPYYYTWDFGDGSVPENTIVNYISHSFSSNGNYTVTVSLDDANGCATASQVPLAIYTTPASFSTVLKDTCLSIYGVNTAVVQAEFQSDSNRYALNYDWNFSIEHFPYTTFSNFYISFYGQPAGTYDVSMILTNEFNCSDTAFVPQLITIPGPSGYISFTPLTGCSPLEVEFHGNTTTTSMYCWDFGDGNIITDTNLLIINHTFNSDGRYVPNFYVGFQMTGQYCYNMIRSLDTINVRPLNPIISQSQDTLFVSPEAVYYEWNLNGLPFISSSLPYVIITQSGMYDVTAHDSSGCIGTSGTYTFTVPGIADIAAENNIQIYPSITFDKIQVKLENPGLINDCILFINDITGREIYSAKLNNELTDIVLGKFEKGIYIVNVMQKNGKLLTIRMIELL